MKLGAWLIMMYGSDAMESFFSNTNTELIKHGYKSAEWLLRGHQISRYYALEYSV